MLAASNGLDQNALYAIIGVGVFMLMYLFIRPKMRRNKDPFEKPFVSRSLSQQRSVERQMETLLVELSEMSRQMSAQLETRSVKLELLIKEADEKIGILKTLAQTVSSSTVAHQEITAEPAERAPLILPPEPAMLDPQHAEIYRRIDQGQTLPQIAAAMNRPNGEIQLILALRPKEKQA